jgi:hypothetical protein
LAVYQHLSNQNIRSKYLAVYQRLFYQNIRSKHRTTNQVPLLRTDDNEKTFEKKYNVSTAANP